ncbi:MAG: toll/interleukin-1 receptor domain-containing protein [Blastocatellia bacterium]
MSEDARANKIEVFVSFANGDEQSHRQREVWKHLTDCLDALRDEGVIRDWFCQAIDAGGGDAEAIGRLKRSDVIIFALGQNYLDHPERYQEVLKNLPESGRYLVFSLLLYPSTWYDSPFKRFNLLPSNKAPVTEWSDVEGAFIEIKEAIKQARRAIYPERSRSSSSLIDPPVESPVSTGIFDDDLDDEKSSIVVLPPPMVGADPALVEPSPPPAPSPSPPEKQESAWEKDDTGSFLQPAPASAHRPEPGRQSRVEVLSSILSGQELERERERIGADAVCRADRRPYQETQNDIVDCTVFAPPSAPRNSVIFVQVYAHLQEQVEGVIRLASEFDSAGERRAVKSLEEVVARGTKLSFELIIPGLRGADPVQSIVWRGKPDAAQFAVEIPGDCPLGARIASVIISAHSVPIGHIRFKLQITEPGSDALINEAVGEEAKRYNLAFISYASADRSKVLARVQMLDLVGVRYFQDVLNLRPGDTWTKEIYRNIDSCDLFLLFWSKAARDSEWVMKEVRYARKRQPPPEIRPIVLEGPPAIAPPEDLNDLHFNDKFVYFMLDQGS